MLDCAKRVECITSGRHVPIGNWDIYEPSPGHIEIARRDNQSFSTLCEIKDGKIVPGSVRRQDGSVTSVDSLYLFERARILSEYQSQWLN